MSVLSLFVSVPLGGAFSVFILGQEGIIQLITVFFTSGIIVWALNMLKQPAYSFDLTPVGIVKNQKVYRYEDITEVYIDNRHRKGVSLASAALHSVAQPGHTSATSAIGAGLIAGSASLGARVNYRVNIRYGKDVIPLAISMNEDSAISLFSFLSDSPPI